MNPEHGARQAINIAYNHQLRGRDPLETDGVQYTVRGGDGKILEGISAGHIISAIDWLGNDKPLYKHWLLWAYADKQTEDRGRSIRFWLHNNYCVYRNIRRSDRFEPLRRLATLAILDFPVRDVTGRPKYTVEQLCAEMGYDNKDRNWARDFGHRFDDMENMLNELAGDALSAFFDTLETCKRIRRKRDLIEQSRYAQH